MSRVEVVDNIRNELKKQALGLSSSTKYALRTREHIFIHIDTNSGGYPSEAYSFESISFFNKKENAEAYRRKFFNGPSDISIMDGNTWEIVEVKLDITPMEEPKVLRTFHLPEDVDARLRTLAHAEGVLTQDLVVEAVRNYLSET